MLRFVFGAIALTALLPFAAGAANAPGLPFDLFTDPFTARPVIIDIDGDSVLRAPFDPTPGAPNSGDEGSRTFDIFGNMTVTSPSVGEVVPFGMDCDISLDVGLGAGCLLPTALGSDLNAVAPLFGAPAVYDPNTIYTPVTDPLAGVIPGGLVPFTTSPPGVNPADPLVDLGTDGFGITDFTGFPPVPAGFDARLSNVAGDFSPAPGDQLLAQGGALFGVNPLRAAAFGGESLFGGLEGIQGIPGVYLDPALAGTDGPGGVDDGGFKGLYAATAAALPPGTGQDFLNGVAGMVTEFTTPQQLAEVVASPLLTLEGAIAPGGLGDTVKATSFNAAQYTPIGACALGAQCGTITLKARAVRDFFRMATIAGITGDPFNPLDDVPSAGNDGIVPLDPDWEGGPNSAYPSVNTWSDWVWTIDIATGSAIFTGTGAGWPTTKQSSSDPVDLARFTQTFPGPWNTQSVGIQNPLDGTLTPTPGFYGGVQSNTEIGQSAVDFFCTNDATVPWVAPLSAPGSTYNFGTDTGGTITAPPNVVPGNIGATAKLVDPTAADPNQPCISLNSIPYDPETGAIVALGASASGTLFGGNPTFGGVNGFREVPEPGTALLLGIGLAGLALVRRRS